MSQESAMNDELMELRERVAELKAQVEHWRSHYEAAKFNWDQAISERDAARKDTERLDWLETERQREQEYMDGKREWTASLFRQNIPITRQAIDAARAAAPKD